MPSSLNKDCLLVKPDAVVVPYFVVSVGGGESKCDRGIASADLQSYDWLLLKKIGL